MHTEALYYDNDKDIFYFKTDDRNCLKIHRAGVAIRDGTRVVTFPATYPSGVVGLKDFKALFPKGKALPTAMEQIEYLRNVPDRIQNITLLNSHNYTFKVQPYVHQALAIEYMLNFPKLALGMEMGLGKTFIAVHYVDITRQKTLVFGPRIVIDTWRKELARFTDLKVIVYRGTIAQREKIQQSVTAGEAWDVVLSNFEGPVPKNGSSRDLQFFTRLKYSCVIVDEASRLIGHKSARAGTISKLADKASHVYLLSGTLSKGKPTDIFMPFRIMDQEILGGNFWKFKAAYCVPSPTNKHAIVGYRNLDRLKARIDPYILAKKREECIDLPERQIVEEHYDMTEEQRSLYEAVKELKAANISMHSDGSVYVSEDGVDCHGIVRCHLPVVKITKLRQILSGFITLTPERDDAMCNECQHLIGCVTEMILPWDTACVENDPHEPNKAPEARIIRLKENPKMDLAMELLTDMGVTPEIGVKCLVWVEYREDLRCMGERLKAAKIPFVTPYTPDCESLFQEDPKKLVFLGQVSQGIGLTLTAAKYTLMVSHSLELEHRSQAMDRNYRIGQNNKVFVKDLVCPDSIERGIMAMLHHKLDVADFIQTNNVCTTKCTRLAECLEACIRPYTEGCVFYEDRRNAERKPTIEIT